MTQLQESVARAGALAHLESAIQVGAHASVGVDALWAAILFE